MKFLPEGEWAVTESQRGMMQDKKKFLCQGAAPWKKSIFLSRALYRRVSKLLLSPKLGWRRMKWKLYAKVQCSEKWAPSREEGWALYRGVSELLLSPKERWRRMKWNSYANVQRPEKRASSSEEGLSSLPEGEWAVADFQRGMTQDKMRLVCRCATPWKMGILLRGRVELFTKWWVSWWVSPKEGWCREWQEWLQERWRK